MCNPAQLAPRPTAVGAGAERELGTGEFSVAVPCPPARGWAVVVYLPLQVTLQGPSPASGMEKDSGVGWAGRGDISPFCRLQTGNCLRHHLFQGCFVSQWVMVAHHHIYIYTYKVTLLGLTPMAFSDVAPSCLSEHTSKYSLPS